METSGAFVLPGGRPGALTAPGACWADECAADPSPGRGLHRQVRSGDRGAYPGGPRDHARALPGALELVYDNYNALAVAYGPTERLADVICSIAAYPRWISLFLAHGATLDDPDGLLKGGGSRIRHVVLQTADRLQSAGVAALLDQALRQARPPLDPAQPFRTVVKSISARQRPRRPPEK